MEPSLIARDDSWNMRLSSNSNSSLREIKEKVDASEHAKFQLVALQEAREENEDTIRRLQSEVFRLTRRDFWLGNDDDRARTDLLGPRELVKIWLTCYRNNNTTQFTAALEDPSSRQVLANGSRLQEYGTCIDPLTSMNHQLPHFHLAIMATDDIYRKVLLNTLFAFENDDDVSQ
ncbi:MAG: hypothetical protein M1834_008251 [Cirrosporium novae-zelandiae]|nr:MAG: hypothetical protein M1834_008251 [Cirrosporium novae-zelandiae]